MITIPGVRTFDRYSRWKNDIDIRDISVLGSKNNITAASDPNGFLINQNTTVQNVLEQCCIPDELANVGFFIDILQYAATASNAFRVMINGIELAMTGPALYQPWPIYSPICKMTITNLVAQNVYYKFAIRYLKKEVYMPGSVFRTNEENNVEKDDLISTPVRF